MHKKKRNIFFIGKYFFLILLRNNIILLKIKKNIAFFFTIIIANRRGAARVKIKSSFSPLAAAERGDRSRIGEKESFSNCLFAMIGNFHYSSFHRLPVAKEHKVAESDGKQVDVTSRYWRRKRRGSIENARNIVETTKREVEKLYRVAPLRTHSLLTRRVDRSEWSLRKLDAMSSERERTVMLASSAKSFLRTLKPLRLEFIQDFFRQGIELCATDYEKLEIASVAFQALIESMPACMGALQDIKAAYDERLLEAFPESHDMKQSSTQNLLTLKQVIHESASSLKIAANLTHENATSFGSKSIIPSKPPMLPKKRQAAASPLLQRPMRSIIDRDLLHLEHGVMRVFVMFTRFMCVLGDVQTPRPKLEKSFIPFLKSTTKLLKSSHAEFLGRIASSSNHGAHLDHQISNVVVPRFDCAVAFTYTCLAFHESFRLAAEICSNVSKLGLGVWKRSLRLILCVQKKKNREASLFANRLRARGSYRSKQLDVLDVLAEETRTLRGEKMDAVVKISNNLKIDIRAAEHLVRTKAASLKILENSALMYEKLIRDAEREGRRVMDDEIRRVSTIQRRSSISHARRLSLGAPPPNLIQHESENDGIAAKEDANTTAEEIDDGVPATKQFRDAAVQTDSVRETYKVARQSMKKWTKVKNVWKLKKRKRPNKHIAESFLHLIKTVPQGYKPKSVAHKTCKRFIYQIYVDREAALSASSSGSSNQKRKVAVVSDDLKTFVYDFFTVKFGVPKLSELRLVDFLVACKSFHEKDTGVHMFCRFISVAVDKAAYLDSANFDFFLSAYMSVRRHHPSGVYLEDPGAGTQWTLLEPLRAGLRESFSFLTREMQDSVLSRLQNLQKRIQVHEKFVGARNLVRGSGTMKVVDVDDMMMGAIDEAKQAKEAIKRRLRALFVAADVDDEGVLSYKRFTCIVRAADPSFSQHMVATMYREALKHGSNSEVVQDDDFVHACIRTPLLSPASWKAAEIGLASIGPKEARNDTADDKARLHMLRDAWTASKGMLLNDAAQLEQDASSPSGIWEALEHKKRIEHAERLLEAAEQYSGKASVKSRRNAVKMDLMALLASHSPTESAWQAYRWAVYELEKRKRATDTSRALSSLRYIMRWKRKMKTRIIQYEFGQSTTNQKKTSVSFLAKFRSKVTNASTLKTKTKENPVFSRCRWHRMEDFMRRIDDPKFDINTVDSCENSLLHIAAQNGHLDIVQILLERGIDVDAQNCSGQTALHFSKFYGYKSIYYMLKVTGNADDRIRNSEGKTCYEMATI